MNNKVLLSIAIPTFNRAKYLDRCLSYIFPQVLSNPSTVEIIVSDNCSTDNTHEIVKKYISKGLNIRYFKNEVNKGMDFNFSQCYLKSTGKYIVAFSDDDILFPGALYKIISIIENSEYGLIHLNSKELTLQNNIKDIETINKVNLSVYNDTLSTLNRINHWISFISGNIVNRKFVTKEIFKPYMGTNIVHVPLILDSISKSKQNIVIETPLIGIQIGNSGGYNLLKVFGVNFFNILNNYDPKIKDLISKYLIFESLPGCIYSLRFKNHTYIMEEEFEKLLKIHFKSSYIYYFIFYPMLNLPKFFAEIYLVLISIYFRCVKVILNQIYSKRVTVTIKQS